MNTAFTGQHIGFIAGSFVLTGQPDAPTRMSWEYAARYANWLCAGKDPDAPQSDFESGAYDTSTFTQNPDGTWNHQAERSPGALFFLPTIDEWTKASAWAPDLDRYWYRQGSQDEPLISGFPQNGGETNAGPAVPLEFAMPVGSYAAVTSPWGLLDTSGGVRELTETAAPDALEIRITRGSSVGLASYAIWDRLDFPGLTFAFSATAGLRLASAVPSPGAACVVLGLAGFSLARRR